MQQVSWQAVQAVTRNKFLTEQESTKRASLQELKAEQITAT